MITFFYLNRQIPELSRSALTSPNSTIPQVRIVFTLIFI